MSDIRENAAEYRNLINSHIYKENNVLFPMADRFMNDDDAVRIIDRFEEIERDRVGVGKHEAYHEMLHSLKVRYGI